VVTYNIVKIVHGKEIVVDTGPLAKMNDRLRQLKGSTRKGSSGRGGQKYRVEYELRKESGA
jgi:hypothetical protein